MTAPQATPRIFMAKVAMVAIQYLGHSPQLELAAVAGGELHHRCSTAATEVLAVGLCDQTSAARPALAHKATMAVAVLPTMCCILVVVAEAEQVPSAAVLI